MIAVKVYNSEGKVVADFDGDDCIDFVSLVSRDSYGPPALIAPNKGQPPLAKVEDRVLYINTSLVPFWTGERLADR